MKPTAHRLPLERKGGLPVRVSGKRVVQRGFYKLRDGAACVRRVASHLPHELVIQI